MKKNNLTEIVFILDRSGSMAGLEGDTIGGFNSLLKTQKAETGKACLSVPSGDLRVVRLVLHTADENRQGGLSLTAGR